MALFYMLNFAGSCFVGFYCGSGRVNILVMGMILHISLRLILSWVLVGTMGLQAVAVATGLGWVLVVSFQTLVYRDILLRTGEKAK